MSIEFKYIHVNEKDWMDNLPCPGLLPLIIDSYAGFIPPDNAIKLLGGRSCNVHDARFLRGIAHGHEYGAAADVYGQLRQLELEEVAQFIAPLIEGFEATNYFVHICWPGEVPPEGIPLYGEHVEEEENPRWSWGCRLSELFHENRSYERPLLERKLASGRVVGQIVMLATASLIQCDRCIEAYISGDIESVVHYMSDIHGVISSIDKLLFIETISHKARFNGRKACKDSKQEAMAAVRMEFDRWQKNLSFYTNDAQFAIKMRLKYPVLTNEGSIKNACTRWRNEKGHSAASMTSG